jgi:hypothetical protein
MEKVMRSVLLKVVFCEKIFINVSPQNFISLLQSTRKSFDTRQKSIASQLIPVALVLVAFLLSALSL